MWMHQEQNAQQHDPDMEAQDANNSYSYQVLHIALFSIRQI